MQVNSPSSPEPELPPTAALMPDPVAMVAGEPMVELPTDLYIPPDALEVFLDAFEGPLDLLLYLIKRQNLDILNIPIAQITAQYMNYIALMESMRFELAAEYLLMAAMLAEIKSRMLLPRIEEESDDEDDPRAELIRRLQEYERIKDGAENLDILPRMQRENFQLQVVPPVIEREAPQPDLTLKELLLAFQDVAERARLAKHHNIDREQLSVRARMAHVLNAISIGEFCEFSTLFNPEEGRLGVVVTFLAVLELCKEASIDIVQAEPFAPIYLKPRGGALVSEPVQAVEDNEEAGDIAEVDESVEALDSVEIDDSVESDESIGTGVEVDHLVEADDGADAQNDAPKDSPFIDLSE